MNTPIVENAPSHEAKHARDPERTVRARISLLVRRRILNIIDHGWFGLTPLKTHAVICGFPRSGSTLLHLMLCSCVASVRHFGRELPAIDAERWNFRNHEYMVTKRPRDVFLVDDIRDHYSSKPGNPRFIVTVRDPRDVLTSIHADHPENYYVSCERWEVTYEQVRRVREDSDVLVVRFEDLVRDPERVEGELGKFIGWRQHKPLRLFHETTEEMFENRELNGVRPLDSQVIGKWNQSRHRQRIREIVDTIPALPDHLIDMGYETDCSWAKAARAT